MTMKLLAPVRTWEARRALRAARRRADDELIVTRLPSPRLAWRTRELCSEENRLELARSLTGVVHASDERVLPTASPIDRVAVRACRPQLLELASRLYDLSLPVTPRGVLLVDRLLTDGSGPLYGRGVPARLEAALDEARAALEGPRGRAA
ncbi:MAG TPA: hypothetical protein VFA97_05515 [Gaiellaceae bacterium]|nr:hypothetical protein [Gaiellaceae bacterium]